MSPFAFDPTAERHFLFSEHGIRTVYRKPERPVADFLHRWQPELDTVSLPPLLIAPFFAALSLAASGGNADHYRYGSNNFLKNFLHDTIRSEPPFIGNSRDVYAEYGLFAIPLPVARVVSGEFNLTPAGLKEPEMNFKIAALWAANIIKQFRSMTSTEPNVLQIALALRCSHLNKNSTNPYRVQFRGSFLPDFVGFYNTAVLLINNPKDTNHAPQQN